MPQQSLAPRVRDRHASESVSDDAGQPIVGRQSLVDEGVVGSEQIDQAPIFADDAAKQEFRLATHRPVQVLVPVREQVDVGVRVPQILQVQPVGGEVGGQRVGPRVGQHAPHLAFQFIRV